MLVVVSICLHLVSATHVTDTVLAAVMHRLLQNQLSTAQTQHLPYATNKSAYAFA